LFAYAIHMKKILFIFLLLFTGHDSKQKVAEQLVRTWLKHLYYPCYYSSISFDKLKPIYSSYEVDTEEGKQLSRLTTVYSDSILRYGMIEQSTQKNNFYKHKLDSIENILRQRNKTHVKKLLKYSIGHVYRAKNKKGVMHGHVVTFELNASLTKVIYEEER